MATNYNRCEIEDLGSRIDYFSFISKTLNGGLVQVKIASEKCFSFKQKGANSIQLHSTRCIAINFFLYELCKFTSSAK